MIDLTQNLVKHLDLCRKIGVGENAICIPLIHSTGRGYEALSIALPGGWTLEDSDTGVDQHLLIAEQDVFDSDLFRKANAFSVEGRVYKIQGQQFSSPSPTAQLREWNFTVHPTGEEFAV